MPRTRGYYGGGYAPGYGGYAPVGGSGCGCLTSMLSLVFTAIIVMTLFAFLAPASCASSLSSSGSQPVQLHTTTTARTKLASSDCTPINQWYDDLAGWIDDPSATTSGMQRFYDKTGVQPYLIVATDIEGNKNYDVTQVETYMRDRYDELFADDGHLILLFCEPYDGEYDPYLLIGQKAQSVIDTDAQDIIYDAIDNYYEDTSLSNSAYFGKVFSESADTIMATNVTTQDSGLAQGGGTALEPAQRSGSPIVMAVAGIACGGVLAYLILRVIRSRSQS
jgi:hypothetical protein